MWFVAWFSGNTAKLVVWTKLLYIIEVSTKMVAKFVAIPSR